MSQNHPKVDDRLVPDYRKNLTNTEYSIVVAF